MKSRKPRERAKRLDEELLLRRPDLRQAVTAYSLWLRGDKRDEERPHFLLPEAERRLVHRTAQKEIGLRFDEAEFEKKMNELQPLVAQPGITDPAHDLFVMLSQPEIIDGFWPELHTRAGRAGSHPGLAPKALLFTTPVLHRSAQLKTNFDFLWSDRRLRSVLEWIEAESSRRRGVVPAVLARRTESQTYRQMHELAKRVPLDLCLETNVALAKAVHQLLGIERTSLAIDGMNWRAWVRQVGQRDSDTEAEIRKRAPNAGPRLIERKNGWRHFHRGYKLVTLVDLATSLPLVFTLQDANANEAKALIGLLFKLAQLWPDINVEAIAADTEWDDRRLIEWTLMNYGIHLIAHRSSTEFDVRFELGPDKSRAVSAFYGDGRIICRRCDTPVLRDGFDPPDRTRLAFGDPASKRPRLRFHCPSSDSCGRPGLHCDHHYSALSVFAHTMESDPKRHAHRLAYLARRSASSESLHSALQLGNKLGLDDASRTHTAKEETVMAFAYIALMMRSALMAADLRIAMGAAPAEPPPELRRVLAR
jgi:hypothetical protein